MRLIKDHFKNKEESDKDSLIDNQEYSSESEEETATSKVQKSKEIVPNLRFGDSCFSYHKLNENHTSNENLSDVESEHYFDPGQLGLLDNPGVVRFGCVDYPEEVSEYIDDVDITASEHNTAPSWIRMSYDDLNLYSNTAEDDLEDRNSYSRILSISLNDVHKRSE